MEASKGRIVGYAAAILSIALLTSIPLGLSHVKYLFAPWGRYQECIAYPASPEHWLSLPSQASGPAV